MVGSGYSSAIGWLQRNLFIGLIILLTVYLYAGWSKPIWIDEYNSFALASLTFREMWITLWQSTGSGINWGQTGVYYVVDWFLLKWFGANAFALRLPSILSAGIMMISAVIFLRLNRAKIMWQIVLVLGVAGQTTLMSYTGEARAYMPMAASTVAMLTYLWTEPRFRRQWIVRGIGVFGFILGAMSHPYWLPYAVVLVMFTVLFSGNSGIAYHEMRLRLQNLPILLLGLGVGTYLIVGGLTWMKGRGTHKAPPLEYMGSWEGFVRTLGSVHMEFLQPSVVGAFDASIGVMNSLITVLPAVFAIAALGLFTIFHSSWRPLLLPPIALVVLAVASSAAISLVSFLSNYWILQRQWLGGLALVVVGVVWGFSNLWNLSANPRVLSAKAASVVVAVAVILSGALALVMQVGLVRENQDAWAPFVNEGRSKEALVESGVSPELLANVNIARGGPVWREHAAFYKNE